jgi:hypothetical protein
MFIVVGLLAVAPSLRAEPNGKPAAEPERMAEDSAENDEKPRPLEDNDSTSVDLDRALFFFVPGPAWGFYYLEYQHALNARHSVNASIEYINVFYSGRQLIRLWGLYRFKLIGRDVSPLDGLTLVPAFNIAQPFDGQTTLATMLLYLSYQYVFDFGLALQAFVGAGYGMATVPVEEYEIFTDFSPSYGLSIGWAF